MTTHHLRSNFFHISIAAPLLALGLLWPRAAQAGNMPLVVTQNLPVSLGGDEPHYYPSVTIKDGGVLSVTPVGASGGTGRLHIKANRIIIEASGVLDAAGAGHRGVAGQAGGGLGGGGYAVDSSGGGGAYFGNGGAGTNSMCATGLFGVGGTKYGDPMTFGLGSAGGAGGVMNLPIGGSGGGSVILEAAEIQIFGTIDVSGDAGFSVNGVGSGGGSGGEIRLQASLFTWGPKAHLLAKGGTGGKAVNASGGSGGGGLIWLRGAPAPIPEVELNVSGGLSIESCAGGEGQGSDGVIDIDTTPFACRDLDGDGFAASICGKEDCDDADPEVNPNAVDKCNGVDSDCNNVIDDAPDACAAGNICVNGMCKSSTLPDAGPVNDGGTPAPPEVLEYRGGCSVPSAPSSAAPLAALGLAFALGTHFIRRARKNKR